MATRYWKMAVRFIKADIWRIRTSSLTPPKSWLVRHLRVILLACRGFYADRCSLRASALTFFTLLSMVPVAAMVFGVAKGFGFEARLQTILLEQMKGQEEIAQRIIDFSTKLLENTRGGVVAGVGLVVLFWTVIRVLSNIENAFNHIWGIRKARSMARKFSDYLSIMVICPILAIAAGSATVYIETLIRRISDGSSVPMIEQVGMKILPMMLVWFMFAFVYVFMPNTKVKLSSALVAGVVSGTIYQMVQWIYIAFQVGVTKYSAIYGSFAALPLFLVWLQLSWLIVLFGAEISFAYQNVDTYEFEPDCRRASRAFKRLLALGITTRLAKVFVEGGAPMSALEISHEMEVPIRLGREVLFDLTNAGVLSEIASDTNGDVAYQPARDPSKLTIAFVLNALADDGQDNIPVHDSPELQKLAAALTDLRQTVADSPANLRLKDI